MKLELLVQGLVKVVSGFIIMALLIFIPADSLGYWQGWLLLGVLFIPMVVAGFILYFCNPELLKKRLNAREEQMEQKVVVALSGLMFMVAFIFAGLNYRFKWLVLPREITFVATIIFILAYILYGEVIRENEYLSRTIEVQENQKVVDTGIYSLVRHPMYFTTLFMFLAMPLILGSLISFIILLTYIPIIVKRIKNEEEVLKKGLAGYSQYMDKVKYRLIPFIW
ncbi:MAG: isoprenylcysteine carboxylmethyltransferase family protein [Pseudobutyrivibrio sp.]|nr:isoprenylcysteine carboxylmethyltransferase family protein [Pseudobutyrivibrio sp.]